MGALTYLTETTTNFVGVDSSSDTRSFSINFLGIFGDNFHNIISGVVMGDPMLYGPAWRIPDPEDETDIGEYERREAISLFLTQPFDLTEYRMIDPGDRFFVRYVSLIMAAAWAVQETNNRDLNANFKIGMVGSIDDQEVPSDIKNDPERYIEFTNPVTTGRTRSRLRPTRIICRARTLSRLLALAMTCSRRSEIATMRTVTSSRRFWIKPEPKRRLKIHPPRRSIGRC